MNRYLTAALVAATTVLSIPTAASAQPSSYERGHRLSSPICKSNSKARRFVKCPRTHVAHYAGGIRFREDNQGRIVGYHLSPYAKG